MVAKAQYMYSNFATFMLLPLKKRAKVQQIFEIHKDFAIKIEFVCFFCQYPRFSAPMVVVEPCPG